MPNLEQAARAGLSTLVVHALGVHAGVSATAVSVIDVIVLLTDASAGIAAEVCSLGALHMAVELLTDRVNDENLTAALCELLRSLAQRPASRETVRSVGGMKLLLAAIEAHPASILVCESVCGALMDVLRGLPAPEIREALLPCLMGSLERFASVPDASLAVARACGAISFAVSSSPRIATVAVQRGLVQLVLRALATHAPDDRVASLAFLVVGDLAALDDTRAAVAASADTFVPLIMRVLRDHADIASVCVHAFRCMSNLLPQPGGISSRGFVAAGALSAVARAFGKFGAMSTRDDASCVRAAANAARNLLSRRDFAGEGALRAAAAAVEEAGLGVALQRILPEDDSEGAGTNISGGDRATVVLRQLSRHLAALTQ